MQVCVICRSAALRISVPPCEPQRRSVQGAMHRTYSRSLLRLVGSRSRLRPPRPPRPLRALCETNNNPPIRYNKSINLCEAVACI